MAPKSQVSANGFLITSIVNQITSQQNIKSRRHFKDLSSQLGVQTEPVEIANPVIK